LNVQIFIDGLSIASQYWKEILILSLSGSGLGAVVAIIWGRGEKASDFQILYLLSGWGLLGILASILKVLGFLNVIVVYACFTLQIVAIGVWYRGRLLLNTDRSGFRDTFRNLLDRKSFAFFWFPVTIFLFILILRLGYIKHLVLPPYSDSPIHYGIVRSFLEDYQHIPSLESIFSDYYHFGYHGIVAWVSLIFGDFQPVLLALIGQYFLAIFPVTIYFFVLLKTESVIASLVASILVGLGWNMPAHGLNWGKYPALVGLALLPVYLGLLYINFQQKEKKVFGLSLLAAISLAWIHSRLLVLILFFSITDLLWKRIKLVRLSTFWKWSTIAVLFSTILFSLFRLMEKGYFRYYSGQFAGSTYLLLFLLFFALIRFPNLSLQYLLVGLLIMLGAIIPLPITLLEYDPYMIDRPFFEMAFVIILSILGGLGSKGLCSEIGSLRGKMIAIVITLLILTNAFLFFPFTPATKTNYVSDDDMFALSWAKDHLPEDALVVIPAQPRDNPWLSSDAGGWIRSLSNRSIYKIAYNIDWRSETEILNLCNISESKTSVFIYSGNMPNSFVIPIHENPEIFESVFYLPRAQMYRLNCGSD